MASSPPPDAGGPSNASKVSISTQKSNTDGVGTATRPGKKITDLPRELLDKIASSLNTKDFNALRLSCKQIENSLFPYWSNAFFKIKQFMISELSLHTLVAISEHPTLSHCLQKLVIGLDCLVTQTIVDLAVSGRYHELRSSQIRLLDSGEAQSLIHKALNKFPNLQAVDIRDFESRTRYRDHVGGIRPPSWRSYGVSQLHAIVNTNWMVEGGDGIGFSQRIFGLVLRALGRSSACPKSLEVIIRGRTTGLPDEAFALFPSNDLYDTLRGLTKLHLDLRLVKLAASTDRPKWNDLVIHDPSTNNIRKFLAATPSVQWLRLNVGNWASLHTQFSVTQAFIKWLSMSPPSDGHSLPGYAVQPIDLPLRTLELGGVHTCAEDFLNLLAKHPLLETISLRNCCILAEKSQSLPERAPQGGHWPSVFRRMLAKNPVLSTVNLSHLRGYNPDRFHSMNAMKIYDSRTESVSRCLTNIDQAMMDHLADSLWTEDAYLKAHRADIEDDQDHDDENDEDDEDDEFDEDDEDFEVDEDEED